MFFASLVVTIAMGLGGIFAQRESFAASAQEKPASTAEVKIDNFSFGPAAITVSRGNNGHVDQSRRYPAHRCQHGKSVQVQSARYRRKVFLHVHKARRVSLFLLDPSEDDRKSSRPMIAAKRRMELEPL